MIKCNIERCYSPIVVLVFFIMIYLTNNSVLSAERNILIEPVEYGDVNGDGIINVVDAIMVLSYVVEIITLEPQQRLRANVNGDINNSISVNDAILILQYCVGLINEFPVTRPAVTHEKYTIIHITDTHVADNSQARNLRNSFEWIVKYREQYGIVIVIHTGDVVNRGYNQHEYIIAESVMKILYDADIPVLISPGNHDYDLDNNTDWAAANRPLRFFNRYFGTDKYQHQPWFGGTYQHGNAENVYYLLNMGPIECLFIALEHQPRRDVLRWANTIISQYSDREVFIATHEYMDSCDRATRRAPGEQIWEITASRYDNISHLFCGHSLTNMTDAGNPTEGVYRADMGKYNNTVFQFYHNWQNTGNRGNGRFRKHIFNFTSDQDNVRVNVESFIPPDNYLYSSNHRFTYKINSNWLKAGSY